jgi:hypothetical protein
MRRTDTQGRVLPHMIMANAIFPLLASAAISALPCLGQARYPQPLTAGVNLASRSDDSISVSEAGLVTLRRPQDSFAVKFQTGVTVPGGGAAFGYPHVQHLLIVGRDAQAGRLEHWATSGYGQWSLASSLALPGVDFSGASAFGGELYLLDCNNGLILRGIWDPSLSLAVFSPAIWADASTVPVLANARTLTLAYRTQAATPSLPTSGVFLYPIYDPSTVKFGTLVADVGGVPQWTPAYWDQLPGLYGPLVDSFTAIDGASSLRVLVSGQQSVEVVNAGGGVIGSATSVATDKAINVALSSPLVVGQEYGVRVAGATFSRKFVCVQRYGFPETLLDGTALGRAAVETSKYHINNTEFSVECPIYRTYGSLSGAAAPARNYIGVLIVGFTSTAVVPFDNGQGANQLLNSEYWLGATGGIAANHVRGYVEMRMPLANDPGLVGAVLKTQFAIFDGTWYRLSEVIGCVIGQP